MDKDKFNYLYQRLPGGKLVPPPTGMRSSVPLGGISTGSVEWRADGTFHEWTIMNQSPAAAAKIQVIDDVLFGMQSVTVPKDVSDSPKYSEFTLRTHPPEGLPGVKAIKYEGAYPVTRLTVMDDSLPIDVSVTALSTYFPGQMDKSATPAVLFLINVTNHEAIQEFSAMLTIPGGMEQKTMRNQAASFGQDDDQGTATTVKDEQECFANCDIDDNCNSWTYFPSNKTCLSYETMKLNTYSEETMSGIQTDWVFFDEQEFPPYFDCLSKQNPGSQGSSGDMSACVLPIKIGNQTIMGTQMFGKTLQDIWSNFKLRPPSQRSMPDTSQAYGATRVQVKLMPHETVIIPIVMAWNYPHRDFVGKVYGNHYASLFKDSKDVVAKTQAMMEDILTNITAMHSVFFDSSLPEFLQDLYVNSLSHIRSAMWFYDGRWRQWEANDCTNIDSVHNDGERHIPYVVMFPNSTRNKMYSWAKSALSNGMIPEQLRCNAGGPSFEIDIPCGRIMSDVSSMFIVYLLELYKWADDKTITKQLWPAAKKATEWQMSVSSKYGIPVKLQNTYDILGLDQYTFSTYNSAFHLLAIKAAQELATAMGDNEFANNCSKAFTQGQQAMEKYLWNDTLGFYLAYKQMAGEPLPKDVAEGDAPIMTDSFYAQVLAYSLGLGSLVNEEHLLSHMKKEWDLNKSPYGMLVMTGRYKYPGPPQDNAVWMMGNPNWASINLHLKQDPKQCLDVANQSLNRWRSDLNDQWNIAGIMGGLKYGADGQPYITSHYGYFMSSWHIIFALSGQNADLPNGMLTFDPKVKEDTYTLPVLLPGVLGSISQKRMLNTYKYTFTLSFGNLELSTLAVGESKYDIPPGKRVMFTPNKPIVWTKNV